jgi:hypothetical protein
MMPPFFKTHGSHCFLRSFKTSCPSCGEDVLYWECTHGSKVFFQYPPYGKLIKHICKKYKGKNLKNKYSIIIKRPKGLLESASPSCPFCGKLFKNEINLTDHLKQLRKTDILHKTYFNDDIKIEKEEGEDTYKKVKKNKPHYKALFGRLNISNKR